MTSVDEPICRFCFEGPEESNPLIEPCKCVGSTKHVHLNCIRRWRTNTTNHEWVSRCQLCLADYEVFVRWPKEDLPHEVAHYEFLTQRHFIVTTMMYYFHLTFLSFYPILRPYLPQYPQSAPSAIWNLKPVQSAYSHLQFLYFTRISYGIYLAMLCGVTLWYMKTYYYAFWKHIRNRRMYAMLWISCITDHGLLQTPFMTLFLTLGSAFLAALYMIPFGYLYVFMLSYISTVHMTIVRRINANAELF
jgi:hypothetical protein